MRGEYDCEWLASISVVRFLFVFVLTTLVLYLIAHVQYTRTSVVMGECWTCAPSVIVLVGCCSRRRVLYGCR